jgi:putative endopeptidase
MRTIETITSKSELSYSMRRYLSHFVIVAMISGCNPGFETSKPIGKGFNRAFMDSTVRAQDDLHRFVNGGWLNSHEIPDDRSSAGAVYEVLDSIEVQLNEIIDFAATAEYRPAGSDEQKVGDFFLSYMDTARADELGLSPLMPELNALDHVATTDDLISFIGVGEVTGVADPISMGVDLDAKDASTYILIFSQSGLGLPNRDYYFEDQFAEVRQKYVEHIATMFALAGDSNPDEHAQTVYDVEERLASSHWSQTKNRDRDLTYNKMSLDQIQELMPNLNWDLYVEKMEIDISKVDSVIVRQPDYFEALDQALAEIPVDNWKTYMRFRVLSSAAPRLSSEFVEANFDFFGRSLNGQPAMRPRWKRAVQATDGATGDLVGRLYVKKHFPDAYKAKIDELAANLRKAFELSIDELEWMSDETKAKGQEKLRKFTMKIGYPDEWKDYSALDIAADDLYGNTKRTNAVTHIREMQKLGQPVDKGEWLLTPQTLNAYYYPSMNEIVFPAAILQPPFFDVSADDALNYGAIGSIIGHEFSHGFDDQGRKSDGDGNLTNWWTEEDEAEFKRRADVLVEQYNGYQVFDDASINGELTLGENIGDLAGVTMAFRAYKLSLNGKEPPVIGGFTGEQRFFLGYASSWRRKRREGLTRRYLVADTHSPARYRTNGVVVNMPEFVAAFDVKEGDGMWKAPEDRVKIW